MAHPMSAVGGGALGMGGIATMGPSRTLCVPSLRPAVTYEELFDAVGAFGNIESIKLIPERGFAFINFVETSAAFNLMAQTGGEIHLQGQSHPVVWARTQPLPRHLYSEIRAGATRNLYVANVPEHCTEQALIVLFSPFGDLESIRHVSRKLGA